MPPMPSGTSSRPRPRPRCVHMWRMPIARYCSWQRRPGGGDAETSRTKCRKRSVLARVCRIGPWHLRRQQEQQQQPPPQQGNTAGTPALQGPGRFRRKGKQRLCSAGSRRGGGGGGGSSSRNKLESIPEEESEEAQDDLRILFFPDLWTACRALNLDREQVSQRGSSSMYRGTMDPDAQAVSVRILSRDLGPEGGGEEEEELEAEAWLAWLGDVRRVSAIRHPNWVKLLAYCLVEKSNHHMLVYEALPGTSLHSRLADRRQPPVPWPARMKIAVDGARCLANLHQQESSWRRRCSDDHHPQQRPKLLCGSLNAHTVLLERATYSPKLFFVKLRDEWPLRFTIADATPAAQTAFRRYLAAHFCKEMDVFNFGLLLLHLLAGGGGAGRHKKKMKQGTGGGVHDWAKQQLSSHGGGGRSRKLSSERVAQLVDKRLRGRYPSRAAKEVAALALRCVAPEEHERPSMCEVVLGMERAQTMLS